MLEIQPITFAEACDFIAEHHRHHDPPQGWKFGMAVNDGEKVVGVVVVGRPVSRYLDDGWPVEVTRCCTDGTKDACSKLYAAAWRAAKAMGYKRMITYILGTEDGTSLKASGFRELYKSKGGEWNCQSRPRVDHAPTCEKTLWEVCDDAT